MPQALAHFAFGMAMTVLVIVLLPTVIYPRSIAFCGGIWAMLPDIHWVIPATRPWKHIYHDHWIANIFWFHHFLDTRIDPGDTDLFVALMILFLTAVTLLAERRAYRRPKTLSDTE